ncbi:MAG: CapA family protein [Candidatus Pacebacteria bacterium]|nr:CapA family protein [Candidatus Paceibacterota bacterium]
MKILSWVLVVCGFLVLAGVLFFGLDAIALEYNKINNYATVAMNDMFDRYVAVKDKTPEQYRVLLVGDIMLDRGVKSKVYQYGGDYAFLFNDITDVLSSADITFGNLEGSVSDVGADTGKPYSFRFEPKIVDALAGAGFDVVALANNHTFDWGHESLCASVSHLDRVGIFGSGAGCDTARAEQPFIKELSDGTMIGFLSFTEFYKGGYATEDRAGLARYTEENMLQRIADLKTNGTDVVFVSIHWGTEYHTRSNEMQQELGRKFIEAGADVVVGHHPHVAQEIEKYQDGWIIYSLGNFIFDQKFSEQTMKGLMAEVIIQDGAVASLGSHIVRLNENYQPGVDLEGKYEYVDGAELEAAHVESHRIEASL